jgi:hypothetical protein
VELRFIDEFEHGFGWTPEGDRLERASHAVRIGSAVWLTDVLDGPGIDDRIRELGEPRGVIQLLDRHERDCSAIARRLGVPLHVTPFDGVPDAPFEVIPVVRSRFWKEVALWFAAERVLVVGDALGTVGYFRAPDEPVGVHPFLRLKPPRKAFAGLEPLHVLCGHGQGGHGEGVPEAVRQALAKPRRRLPQALLNGLREARSRPSAQ